MGFQVDFISTLAYQENGTAEWIWPVGDAATYQSFAVKPAQFNCDRCGITRIYYSRGNGPGNGLDVHIIVNVSWGSGTTGGLLSFYGIGAPA
jgi:hypothetical protein